MRHVGQTAVSIKLTSAAGQQGWGESVVLIPAVWRWRPPQPPPVLAKPDDPLHDGRLDGRTELMYFCTFPSSLATVERFMPGTRVHCPGKSRALERRGRGPFVCG